MTRHSLVLAGGVRGGALFQFIVVRYISPFRSIRHRAVQNLTERRQRISPRGRAQVRHDHLPAAAAAPTTERSRLRPPLCAGSVVMTNVSTRAPDWQTYINKNVMEAGAATTAAVFDPDMKVLGVSEGFEVRRLAIPGSTTGMHHCSSAMHRRARGCGGRGSPACGGGREGELGGDIPHRPWAGRVSPPPPPSPPNFNPSRLPPPPPTKPATPAHAHPTLTPAPAPSFSPPPLSPPRPRACRGRRRRSSTSST